MSSAVACDIIGTGDGELKNHNKSESVESKAVAKDIVFEIVNNALDIAVDELDVTFQRIMDKNLVKEYKGKHGATTKEKSAAPLIGTGDQRSNQNLDAQEPIHYHHPPVEKKNRLTDLVKNSKQILAKIMMNESKSHLEEEKQKEEKIVEVIELDCVQLSDIPFKCTSKTIPENVPLPKHDSHEILQPPPSDESMDEIGLSQEKGDEEKSEKKRMTFPRASGSRAKAVFAAKCRTLKREATNLKKKKWNVGGKIAGFFKKKREEKDGTVKKSKSIEKQKLNNVTE